MLKLNTLTLTETRILLSRFFEKVVDLRESVQSKEIQFNELEVGVTRYWQHFRFHHHHQNYLKT